MNSGTSLLCRIIGTTVDLASFGASEPREDGKPNGYYGLMIVENFTN